MPQRCFCMCVYDLKTSTYAAELHFSPADGQLGFTAMTSCCTLAASFFPPSLVHLSHLFSFPLASS